MKAIIHFTVGDHEDSIVISGTSEDEIREKAEYEISRRGGKDPWSEIVEE